MLVKSGIKQPARLAAFAFTATMLGAIALPLAPANAQAYLGWDFGNGWGIGIGTPPSAYEACPNYGFPGYHECHYYGYYR
jgi:hypothetical protein